MTMTLRSYTVLLLLAAGLSGCTEDVLVFPAPEPAAVRIVNTTQDVALLETVVDGTVSVTTTRGATANAVSAPAGRPVGFVFKSNGQNLRRDTLFYTLGGGANVILFARGSTAGLVEFRRALQDTTIAADADPVVRFVHMAENTDQFVTLEVWEKGGSQAFPEIFDPGIASSYRPFSAGTHTFEVREWSSTNVAAELTLSLERGKAYVLYAWDAAPPVLDSVALSAF